MSITSKQDHMYFYRLRRQVLIIGLFLCFILMGKAQELRFQNFTIEDGFSAVGTYHPDAIIQDKEGFMWFSSFNGVNRFDGQTFKVFRDDPSIINGIGDEMTGSLFVASDGKVWIGTADKGIFIFDPETEFFEQLLSDPEDSLTICGNAPYFIKEDQKGNIWLGNRFGGVCRWSPQDSVWQSFDELQSDGHSFYESDNSTIYIGTARGLYQKKKDSEKLTKVPDLSSFIIDMVELKSGNILTLIRPRQLIEINPVDLTYKPFEIDIPKDVQGTISYLTKSQDGTIWIGSIGQVFRLLPDEKTVLVSTYDPEDDNSGLIGANMFSYEDKAGSMWYMSMGNGISVTHNSNNPFEVYEGSYVTKFFPLDDNSILVQMGSQIKVFDKQTKQISPYSLTSEYDEYHILSTTMIGSKLYIVYHALDHVVEIDTESGVLNKIGSTRWAILGDRDNKLWTSLEYWDRDTRLWISKYEEMADYFGDFIPTSGHLVEIYFDDQNRIWFTSGAGLFRYDFENKTGRRFKEDDPGAPIGHMGFNFFKGSEGRFYINTTMGISIYQPQVDSFISLGHADGLLHNSSGAIVEDNNGYVWIGNPLGLQRLDLETYTFTNYNAEDGLYNNNIYHHKPYCDQEGYLYFGSGDKMIRFHPDSLQQYEQTNDVYLMDFYLSNKLIEPRDNQDIMKKKLRYSQSIDLTFDQNDFGFSFVMPFYYKPKQIEYFYKLEPYEKEWVEADNRREIQYTNIDPGHYTFKVKARTAAGVWSPNIASIDVTISPPWWKTWWAYMSYLFLIGGGAFALYRFQLKRQVEKSEALQLKEMDLLKSRLYTNITHEFRTPLTVIMGMAENIKDHPKEQKLISRNSKNLLRLINQLLDLSKLDSGNQTIHNIQADIIPYLQYLSESFYSMANEKNIQLTFYPEVPQIIMDYDENKIQHVVYNLLSNAIKFTGKGGKIIFHVNTIEQESESVLKLKITDNGVGIQKENVEKIFDRFYQIDNSSTRSGEGSGVGLALTKDLTEIMGGHIEVESVFGKGTSFSVYLPITNNAFIDKTTIVDLALEQKDSVIQNIGQDFEEDINPPHQSNKPIILLVEDNRDVATYIKDILKEEYQVVWEVNGQRGLDRAFDLIPDLIISDVMMPEMDGYEMTKKLKTDERTSHVPIILLTAKSTEEAKIAGLKTGADAYLMKPFIKEELMVRLQNLLDLRKKLQQRYASEDGIEANVAEGSDVDLSMENFFLQKLQNVVVANMDNTSLNIDMLCKTLSLSQSQLYRKLNALTNKTPNQFIRTIRLNRAVKLLKDSDLSISEVAYSVGFTDPNYFSRVFHKEFGKSPRLYRK